MGIFLRVLMAGLLPSLAAAQPVQVLHAFVPSPGHPDGALIQLPDGSFYGPLSDGGVYRLDSGGQVTTFPGGRAHGALVRGLDGGLYGTTTIDGAGGKGTVFRVDPASGAMRTLHAFTGANEGSWPLGGLVPIGPFLYGVTRASVQGFGTIFRVDAASGELTTLHYFGNPAVVPSGPMVLGLDGRLYGTTSDWPDDNGTIFRFDPASGAFAVVHEFTSSEGNRPNAPLLVDADGSLYGTTLAGGPGASAGTIFRFDPATAVLQVLFAFDPATGTEGRNPGPLMAAADGHLYGTTAADPGISGPGVNEPARLFRVRRLGGGAVAYEALRAFDPATTGVPYRAPLTAGADGFVYGYAMSGGPATMGTIFRFDPLAAGPPSDPLQFTVLHDFRPTTYFGPSTPVAGPDGFLYGTTLGGPTMRGGVYRLDGVTGQTTILGDLPGGFAGTPSVANSPLVLGADARLYGTSTSTSGTTTENRIFRVDPVTGVATALVTTTTANAYVSYSGLVRTPAGALYGLRRDSTGTHAFRFDPASATVTDVAHATPSAFATFPEISDLLAGADGALYASKVTPFFVPGPLPGRVPRVRHSVDLRRVNLATGTFEAVASLVSEVELAYVGTPVQDAAGTIHSPFSGDYHGFVRTFGGTGGPTHGCALGPGLAASLAVAADGALVAIFGVSGPMSLARCDPATGAVRTMPVNPGVGRPTGPLVTIGTSIYGATARDAASGGVVFRLAASGNLPALDTDADGLPSDWETAYGLDAFAAAGDSGPAGDPDHDGRTNAQELADGTHPRGFLTRYFAEGATGPFFQTAIDLFNPSGGTWAIARLRFLTDQGATIVHDAIVAPASRVSIDPATLPGLAHASFSTVVEADATIAVDRRMSWDAAGYGSHLETGVVAPSPTWYFAEGSTSGAFSLFFLLQNPQPAAVSATVRFLRPAPSPPIARTYTLAAHSRTTIAVNALGPELVSTDLSAEVTASAPIVAERAMYFSRPGQPFAAGHESAGVPAPALAWFLAEGATGPFFDLFVLIANPGSTDAVVEIEYLRPGGDGPTPGPPPIATTRTIPANSRVTIWVDDLQLPAGSGQRPLANAAVSTTVRSTNGVPVIVERAMWWPGPETTADFWYEAHNSPGSTTTATTWAIAGGDINGPTGAETYVLIANPTDVLGEALVSVYFGDVFDRVEAKFVVLRPKSRTNVAVGRDFPLGDRHVAVLVESLGVTPVPIVVERATYASPGGVVWASGGNALATPLP